MSEVGGAATLRPHIPRIDYWRLDLQCLLWRSRGLRQMLHMVKSDVGPSGVSTAGARAARCAAGALGSSPSIFVRGKLDWGGVKQMHEPREWEGGYGWPRFGWNR